MLIRKNLREEIDKTNGERKMERERTLRLLYSLIEKFFYFLLLFFLPLFLFF